MSIQRATPVNELLAKLIFLLLPTAIVSYFLLWHANTYYSIPNANVLQQTTYLAAGMGISALVYAFRFRFLPTFIALVAGFYLVYKGLDKMAIGEFDAFFVSIQFLLFAILLGIGWLWGWGFSRVRYWSVLMGAAILSTSILLIAKAQMDSVYRLLQDFTPTILYAVYIIYASEQIYNYKDKSQKFWWFMTRRLGLFALLAILMFGGVVYLMQGEIKDTVANYGGAGKQGENSMLKQNKDGTFDIKEYSRLRSNLGRSNELLFCAHIDNYFEGTEIPNPLYLTAFYYTFFDTLTETFERDSTLPSNDLFEPDPGSMPLFFTKTDSTVIKNSMATKLRRTVDVEIYNKKLSTKTYVAPNVGYFVQPIAIEKDYRNEFISAYRAKGYVSELNSAYFVYNADDEQIRAFQEARFEVLRKAGGYEQIDDKFMTYYTDMPADAKFAQIGALAQEVTKGKTTTVDKVLAIRDYFLEKDENGKQIYTYTDNPGIPDIPNASKLMYFLFENKKGYCAYYAGATLFMLRSLGIPSRITVGFMTVDRSDKNKGWYWYYADQAHAWVQVYFPGYGWLDFDTTVGNEDAEQSPQPDGTPPMQPPRAWLAADGEVTDIDTVKKLLSLKVKHLVFHDKEYKLDSPATVQMDMKVTAIYIDSIDMPLSKVKKGDEGTAVSYAQALKDMKVINGEKGNKLLNRMPSPAPIDELYLKRKDTTKPEPKQEKVKPEQSVSPKQILIIALSILAGLLLLFLLLPNIIYHYYVWRHKSAKDDGPKAWFAYRAANFYLHQVGIIRGQQTPMQYARNMVDTHLGTNFSSFMNIYLKKKYAKQELTAQEKATLNAFLSPFIAKVKSSIPFKQRFAGFINPLRSIGFFVSPDDEEINNG